jgi:NitT/TauT family transport system ATP-binding protein
MTDTAPVPTRRANPRAPSVTLSGVSKRHGTGDAAVVALQDISLAVAPGQFVCLVGASGCGKTTLLNLVAGLDRPSVGTVDVATGTEDAEELAAGGDRPPGSAPQTGGTGTAMLFQDSALFPWLTVAANVELPLRLRGVGRAERRAVADDLLERVHLGGFGPKRPHELSGGCASGRRWPAPWPRTRGCC